MMIRGRLVVLLTAISLILCSATCVLWVQSYFRRDVVEADWQSASRPFHEWFVTDRCSVWVELEAGRVFGGFDSRPATGSLYSAGASDWKIRFTTWDLDDAVVLYVVEERGYEAAFRGFLHRQRRSWSITFSLAWVVLATLPLPLYAAVRRRRRDVATQCARCGYDLRVTPDRCPECGAIPANPTT